MEAIIESYIRRDAIYAENLRIRTMQQGQTFGDDDLVKLLHRRLQQSDVKKNGWILENFPQTRDQAHQMA
jgi:adenylate kinase family enzyme